MKQHKWPVYQQASFLKRIGELLSQGYPIAGAIESLAIHMGSKYQEGLKKCLSDLKKGLTFHTVLANLGFHRDLIGYVYFAEQHGNFANAIIEGSNLVLKKEHTQRNLFKLLQYPLLLMVITGFLFVFVEKTLLPNFSILFKSMNLEENNFTKIIYAFGKYFHIFLSLFSILAIIISVYYFLIFRKFPILKQKSILTHIPFLGRLLKLLHTHFFSILLSFLLSGGISVSEALQLFEANRRQPFYAALGKEIKIKLLAGESLEKIMSEFTFFEKELAMIIKHGQENGKLDQELFFYSQHCISILEDLLEKSLKTIQPLLYLVIGGLVVSMYLAILLPMYHLMDGI
ncbi:MAG: competence type IV pilus assembly protein ComGB [Bacillota bacterium]|nr:competence type IV pilus assembly protein ComGB [Bacillota bacterium]